MPADLFSRVNLDELYPPFLTAALNAVAACRSAGHVYVATSGFRSPVEQMKLWTQGRTVPGKIVTNLRFGLHNLGLALDFCRDGSTAPGLQPSWRAEDYDPLAQAAEGQGLEAGLYWRSFRDPPHIQWPVTRYGLTISELRKVYDAGGIPAVWAALDAAKGSP